MASAIHGLGVFTGVDPERTVSFLRRRRFSWIVLPVIGVVLVAWVLVFTHQTEILSTLLAAVALVGLLGGLTHVLIHWMPARSLDVVPVLPKHSFTGAKTYLETRWVLVTGLVAISAAALAAVGAVLITQVGLDSMPDLSTRGVVTSGRVVRALPDEHNQVIYTYVVQGSSYQAQNFAEAPNPPASRLRPGDSLYVTYDPHKPQVSCACDPKPIVEGARYAWIPIASTAFVVFVLIVVLRLGWRLTQPQHRGLTP